MDPMPETPAIVEFGRFRILPHRRELLVDGQPIRIGGRAFDVLKRLVLGFAASSLVAGKCPAAKAGAHCAAFPGV